MHASERDHALGLDLRRRWAKGVWPESAQRKFERGWGVFTHDVNGHVIGIRRELRVGRKRATVLMTITKYNTLRTLP